MHSFLSSIQWNISAHTEGGGRVGGKGGHRERVIWMWIDFDTHEVFWGNAMIACSGGCPHESFMYRFRWEFPGKVLERRTNRRGGEVISFRGSEVGGTPVEAIKTRERDRHALGHTQMKVSILIWRTLFFCSIINLTRSRSLSSTNLKCSFYSLDMQTNFNLN